MKRKVMLGPLCPLFIKENQFDSSPVEYACADHTRTIVAESIQCSKEAKQTFMRDIFEDGEDKKLREVPKEYNKSDYHARKTCNYITAVLEDCFSCLPQHKIAIQKDILVRQLLNMTLTIPRFHINKCPVTRDYVEQKSVAPDFGCPIIVIIVIFAFWMKS